MDALNSTIVTSYIGSRLGNYRLMSLLGKGGVATVYLGEHISRHTRVAVKIPHMHCGQKAQDSIFYEASILGAMRHRHIVPMYECSIFNGVPFLVMAYAPYGTIRQYYSAQRPLTNRDIACYVRQVADALQSTHRDGFVHQDIKSDNMLLKEPGRIWLSDFGIAVPVEKQPDAVQRERMGTVAYMAPERLRDEVCFASDQYALGIVAYEWLSGQLPFQGSSLSIMRQHLYATPPSLRVLVPAISANVDIVVQKALEKAPERRFGSTDEFADALAEALLTGDTHYFTAPLARQSLCLPVETSRPQDMQPIRQPKERRNRLRHIYATYILPGILFSLAANFLLWLMDRTLCTWFTMSSCLIALLLLKLCGVKKPVWAYVLIGSIFGLASSVGTTLHTSLAWTASYIVLLLLITAVLFPKAPLSAKKMDERVSKKKW